MKQQLAESAALPFQILESLGLASGYERSFKLSPSRVLANRYLLGVQRQQLNQQQWSAIASQLSMPEPLLEEFLHGLAGANLVLLGFEARSDDSFMYKLYLEYRDQLSLSATAADTRQLLHLGFKWHPQNPQTAITTRYHCLPGLSISQIREHIALHYAELSGPTGLQASLSILELAAQSTAEPHFIYIEVSEAGNPRSSFDLNFYPAGLRVTDIRHAITRVASRFDIDKSQFTRLMRLVENKRFGHLSAGIDRNGEEHFSIYYEA